MRVAWLAGLICATALSAEEPDAINRFLSKQQFLCEQFTQNQVPVPFWIHRHGLGGCRVGGVGALTDDASRTLDVTCEDSGEVLLRETWMLEQSKSGLITIRDADSDVFGTLNCKRN
ncbi:hypothetical protein [Ruegeria sp.]|uniref:hypothetical protein n=1 Tax=Ruegeria sp. TaxID=1879320 RepID=UPI00231A25E1|nr:hypothetical protein [Ruegeria sp.]MDA7963892.1 hypothetical protein [Ruegeria sp.]